MTDREYNGLNALFDIIIESNVQFIKQKWIFPFVIISVMRISYDIITLSHSLWGNLLSFALNINIKWQ